MFVETLSLCLYCLEGTEFVETVSWLVDLEQVLLYMNSFRRPLSCCIVNKAFLYIQSIGCTLLFSFYSIGLRRSRASLLRLCISINFDLQTSTQYIR